MTGVPSADSGHHSAIPDAVAAPWDLQRGTRQARHCSHYCSADSDHPDTPPAGEGVRRRHVSFREGRPVQNGQSPGPSPLGVRDFHVSPRPSSVHARTPTRGSGAVASYYCRWCMQDPSPQGPLNNIALYIEDYIPATTMPPTGTLQDDRCDLRRTKDNIQDDCDARRLPIVYFLQCPTTVPPRFRGKRRLLRPHSCAPPLLVTIKGGGGLPLAGRLWFFSRSKDAGTLRYAQRPPDVIRRHFCSGIPIRHVQPLF